MKYDAIDKKILFELNWNARQTHSSLAKKVRISKQVVRYRIKRLEEKGIIKSYHAVIDWRALGYNATRIYIKWQNINLDQEQEIHKQIRQDPLFMWAIRFEGEFDLGFYVWTKDTQGFATKWFAFLQRYKQFIDRYEIYESVEMIHYPLKFLKEKKKTDEIIIGKNKIQTYDKIDYQILKILTSNAQTPITKIAKQIGMTAKAALYRLRNLEKKQIIKSYFTLIDETILGLEFYKVDFYLNNITKISSLHEFARQHKNIVYRMRTIGGPDFEIELIVKNAKHLKEIINQIRTKFPNIIKKHRSHRFEYSIKQIYLPGESIN